MLRNLFPMCSRDRSGECQQKVPDGGTKGFAGQIQSGDSQLDKLSLSGSEGTGQ